MEPDIMDLVEGALTRDLVIARFCAIAEKELDIRALAIVRSDGIILIGPTGPVQWMSREKLESF